MGIKDIPSFERPREKALAQGFDSLSNAELLAIIINSGNKNISALDIGNEILKLSNGLYNLSSLNLKDLKSVKGINKVKSTQLLALFTLMDRLKIEKIQHKSCQVDVDYILERYSDYFVHLNQEVVLLLVLNRNKRLISERILYRGTDYLVPISIKTIIKQVILHDGYYFYLVHNHPSGNVIPSPQDLLLTFRLKTSIKKMGIHLLDHLIVHSSGYTSINDYLDKEYNKRPMLQFVSEQQKLDL